MITILNRFQQPVHVRSRSAYSALPQLEDAPPMLQQFIAVSDISFHVLVEFQAPEFLARFRDGGVSAMGMSVPKAAVNKNADLMARQHHIGFSWKIFSVQAIPEAMPMQQPPNLHFRGSIAAADASHHARPDFFANYVHD